MQKKPATYYLNIQVLGIIEDSHHNTLGARVEISSNIKGINVGQNNIKNEDLRALKSRFSTVINSNAIIDSKGFVRAKSGSLPRINISSLNNTSKQQSHKKRYLWVEDSDAGLIFWSWLIKELNFDIIVESPSEDGISHGNGQILKAVKHLTDTSNEYYVLMDDPYDQSSIQDMFNVLMRYTANKPNVHIIRNFVGFESIFLSFSELKSWLRPFNYSKLDCIMVDSLYKTLMGFGSPNIDEEDIKKYKKVHPQYKYGTIEKLCSAVIKELTKNRNYFQIQKDIFGDCWKCDCCKHKDVKCNLNLTGNEKATAIYKKSYIERIFRNGGLIL